MQESLTEEYFCSKTNTGFEVLGAANLLDEMGGVKTERVFPGLSVLRKNNKMEVLYPEK